MFWTQRIIQIMPNCKKMVEAVVSRRAKFADPMTANGFENQRGGMPPLEEQSHSILVGGGGVPPRLQAR
jgi:hypothetical protein